MRIFALLLAMACANAFSTVELSASRLSPTRAYGYVPDGFTAESYKKFKEAEAKKNAKKNLGAVGPKGFKSRSFKSFQEALERGEAAHLLPVENAAKRLASGELKPEDIPYMQRGGSWDNSDIKGAKKLKWLQSDKDYANGGYMKEQSVSIFGKGEGLDWTGTKSRRGPDSIMGAAPKFAKYYKAPNSMKSPSVADDMPKKKLFGFF